MRTTVLIPTYRRSKDLQRCLEALQQQQSPPDEVIIVRRDSDEETQAFLEQNAFTALPIQVQLVSHPGQVAALNAGISEASGDIIAITDDDAAPHPEWLARIKKHFVADPELGGIGGRDWMYLGDRLQDAQMHPGASDVVGKLQWFGRVIGNHHLGQGLPRSVDLLKGANMSYRRLAIEGLRFDEHLQGQGAQVHNDLDFSLAVKRRGWKLLYDPEVAVDHFLAERFDKDQRSQFNRLACLQATHNETLILMRHLSQPRRLAYMCWSIVIGTRKAPGCLQMLRLIIQEGDVAIQRWIATIQGRWSGCLAWRQGPKST